MTKRNILLHIVMCALALTLFAIPAFAKSEPTPFAHKPSPAQVAGILKEGNARFVSGKSEHPNTDIARIKQAGAENQGDHAIATIISCSDSRVPVERIFDQGVMDLFIIRVAGNVVQTDEAGSIEYGLAHVNTPLLVVLGHTQCGAVTAVTNAHKGHGHALERNIPALVAPIAPAVQKAEADFPGLDIPDLVVKAIEYNVQQGIRDLFMKSPATRELVAAGKVAVVGAIYNVGTGEVSWMDWEMSDKILKEVEANPDKAEGAMAPAE